MHHFARIATAVLPLLALSSVLAADVIPPAEVQNLRLTRSGTNVVLTYNPVTTNINGAPQTPSLYKVHRGAVPSFTVDKLGGADVAGTSLGTTFTDTGEAANKSRNGFYLVTAVDPGGVEGNARASRVTTPPTNLTSSFSTTGVTLNWTAAAPSAAVAGYEVFYGGGSLNYSQHLDVGKVTSVGIPLDQSTPYFFSVYAYDSEHNYSAKSNETSGSVTSGGGPTQVCGAITANATWTVSGSPYIVTCDVTVAGTGGPFITDAATPVLTIQPGVIVKFAANTGLYIGNGANLGALNANGTSGSPILFTANQTFPTNGYWSGLQFSGATDTSSTVVNNVVVEYAGTNTSAGAGITFNGTSQTVSNTQVTNSAHDGIYITAGAAPTLNNVTIVNVARYGVRQDAATSPTITGMKQSAIANTGYLASGNASPTVTNSTIDHGVYFDTPGAAPTFTGNTLTRFADLTSRIGANEAGQLLGQNTLGGPLATARLEIMGERISTNATWPNLGFPLTLVYTTTYVYGDTATPVTLTLGAGLQLRMATGMSLNVGYSNNVGKLVAQGTAAAPILFTTDNAVPAPGQWYGLYFDTGATPDSILNYVIVEYAGYGSASAIRATGSSPAITNSTIRNNAYYGVNLYGGSSSVVDHNTFSGNLNYDLVVNSTNSAQVTNNVFNAAVYFDTAGSTYTLTGNTFNNYGAGSRPLRTGAHTVPTLGTNTFNSPAPGSVIEVLGENVSSSVTWANLGLPWAIVTSNLTVGGDALNTATLTLPAGTTMKFGANLRLVVGSGAKGALVAQGSVAQPILFTSYNATPAPGQWYGLYFDTLAQPSTVLDRITVEYSGVGNAPNVQFNGCPLTITNSTLRNSSYYGMYLGSGAAATVTGNSFSGNGNYDIYVSATSNAVISGNTFTNSVLFDTGGGTHTVTGNTFNNYGPAARPLRVGAHAVGALNTNTFNTVGTNWIEVLGDTVSTSTTWNVIGGMPYVMYSGDVFVNGDAVTTATLTLPPGSRLKFNSGVRLLIGYQGNRGALNATGTAGSPILFTTNNPAPAPGQWYGLWFDTGAQPSSVMDRCTVEYAGSGYSNGIRINGSSPTIRNSTIRNSSAYGIYTATGASPTLTGNTFSGNANYDLYVSGVSAMTVSANTFNSAFYFDTAGSTYSVTGNVINGYNNATRNIRIGAHAVAQLGGNTFNGVGANAFVEILGETVSTSATWANLGCPYVFVSGDVYVNGDAATNVTLTLSAGTTFKFASGPRLVIGYQGQGTLIAQGTAPSPIVFTTNAASPAPGQWYGLWFDSYTQPATVLDRCTIDYAGGGYNNGIRLVGASPTIKNSIVRNSSYYGIYGTYSGSTYPAPLLQNNTFSGNAQNDVLLEGGSATVTGNTFAHAIRFNSVTGGPPTVQNNTFNTYLPPFQLRVPANTVNGLTGNTFAGFDATSDIEILGDTISGTARWQKLAVPYDVVSSYIYVSGTLTVPAQLTIDPGVTVRFGSGSYLYVGSSNTQGILVANGTAPLPILFTTDASVPASGQWRGLYFDNGTASGTSLQYVTVEYAGSSNYGAIMMYRSDVPISNCTVRNVAYTGIWVQDGSPTIQNTTVLNAGYFGMRFDSASVERTPQVTNNTVTTPANYGISCVSNYSGTFSGNSLDNGLNIEAVGGNPVIQNNTLKNYATYPLQVPARSLGTLTGNVFVGTNASSVIKVLADSVTADGTWAALPLPYDFTTGITYIYKDATTPATVTINPGVTMKFGSGVRIQIGYSNLKGAIVANGTAGSPILFTTDNAAPAPGQWRGLYFDTYAAPSSLQFATIEYAGQYDNAAIYSANQAALTMTDSTVRFSSAYGVYLTSSSAALRFNNFQNNATWGIGVSSGSLPVILQNSFSGNTSGAITELSSERPDARLNYFGAASGPGGSGPGTGQGVSANVVFEPWINQATTRLNYFKDALVTTKAIHAGSFTRFYATLNETSNWSLVFYDTGNNAVRNLSGTGSTIQVDFNGKDNANANLADGPYTYKLSATGTPTGDVAAVAQGSVSVKASLATAEITSPLYNDSFSIGSLVTITGSAANPGFSKYTLEYGAGTFPAFWSSIVSNSTTPITNGTLGTWNTAGLTNGLYSLRLTVTNTALETTVVTLPVNVLAINQLALDHAAFSPNNDGRIDTVTATSTLSEVADWTINVTNTATSEIVRTFTGTGINIVQVWDGKKQDGVTVAPQGNYRFDLNATKNGKNVAQSSSTTLLDLTPPTASITSPTPGAQVFNSVPVNGTALDSNGTLSSYVLDYGIGSSPLTYTQIGTTQTTPVNNGLLGTWSTSALDGSEPVPNGGYQLRLTASDAAGNVSVATVQVSVDNLVFGQVSAGSTSLDTYRGDRDPINFAINKAATVTLKIFPEQPGDAGIVQKQSTASYVPGQNATLWDGTDGTGKVVPDEAYIYVLEGDAGNGRTARFSPTTGQITGAGSGNIPASYNPYTNQFWTMAYTIYPPASRWWMQVTPTGGSAFYVHTAEPHEANTFDVIWDGRDLAGNIVSVGSSVYFPPPTTLRPNYIITQGDTPRVDNWNSDPYWIGASMSSVSRINFTVARDASVKITMLPPNVANPNDPSGKKIYGPSTLAPGNYSITFDPVDPTDPNKDRMLFSNEGAFTFAIEATNPTTGTYQLRRGVVNLYK